MSRKSTRLGWACGLCGLLAAILPDAAGAPPTRVVRVGVVTDSFPYSFRVSDGVVDGFACDITKGVMEVMALQTRKVTGNTEEVRAAFHAGEVDVMQSYAQAPERENLAAFSVPYLTLTGAMVVREGERDIRSFEDLRTRKVLVHRDSLGDALLRRAGMEASIVYAESVRDAMRRLAKGEGDATLASRLTALAVWEHEGIRGLRLLDAKVEGFDVRFCMAVRKEDAALLAQVNEGLAILFRTGRFDEIYEKWFGHLEPRRFSVNEVLGVVAAGLGLALATAIWAAAKQRRLRGQLAHQAEALRLSEERYRGVFEGARNGLLLLARSDQGWIVEQLNPAAAALLEPEPGLDATPPLTRLLAADPGLAQCLGAAAERGSSEEFEHECAGGTECYRIVVSPLGARVLVMLTDITEAVRSRRQLQQQEEQLRQKQKLEAVGTLAGGVAHDFNNLLTAITGNIELALMGLPKNHPEAEGLRLSLQAGKRARDLVRQILAFSRQSAPSREVVALAPMVDETIHLLRTLARGDVEFETQLPTGLPPLLADPAQVHQVLMNLGTNAVQAMRGTRGRLSFHATAVTTGAAEQAQHPELRPGNYVRLAVQDTGPGMSPEVQQRAFEPFFTTKSPGEGTGLGLSVVHGIMRQHSGAVTLYSQAGRGTVFHLYFPTASVLRSAGTGTAAAEAPLGRGERVLFVDDDEAVGRTAVKILQQLGYIVSAHSQPETAWAEYQQEPGKFALVISDLTMPGINGLQLLERIHGLRSAQPFVLSSGFFSETERTEAAARGVALLLPKPFSYLSLSEAAATALRRS